MCSSDLHMTALIVSRSKMTLFLSKTKALEDANLLNQTLLKALEEDHHSEVSLDRFHGQGQVPAVVSAILPLGEEEIVLTAITVKNVSSLTLS